MEVVQVYELVNNTTKEILGESAVLKEDLSNIVDIGTDVINAKALDKYVNALVNRIGKVIFVNRKYNGSVPSVLMDGWEYGSVVEKIRCELPDATENESWELVDQQSYDQDVFYQPKVAAKFFNSKTTFEVPMSFTERQVKQSFATPQELGSFIEMLYTAVENTMTIKIESLIMRTINNMIAETISADYLDGPLTAKSGIKAVNLLKLYNDKIGVQPEGALTADKALTNLDFIKFAAYMLKLYATRLGKMSTLFNVGKKERFTPKDRLHVVLLNEFASAADVYLQSDTFHNEFVKLPQAEEVAYWQGTGTDYDFNSTSKVDVTIKLPDGSTKGVTATGILGVFFDRYALGVNNTDRRVTSHYNAKAEFFSNWYKHDASYFNDLDENFVVFFIA